MPGPEAKMAYKLVGLTGDHEIHEDTFTGYTAKEAALTLAKRLPPAKSESTAAANPTEATLRNYDSHAEFVFDAWAWMEESAHVDEPWMPDEVMEASVEAKQLDEPHEWFVSSHEADRWLKDTKTSDTNI